MGSMRQYRRNFLKYLPKWWLSKLKKKNAKGWGRQSHNCTYLFVSFMLITKHGFTGISEWWYIFILLNFTNKSSRRLTALKNKCLSFQAPLLWKEVHAFGEHRGRAQWVTIFKQLARCASISLSVPAFLWYNNHSGWFKRWDCACS